MQARLIYNMALSNTSQTVADSDTDVEVFATQHLTTLLNESLKYENSIRRRRKYDWEMDGKPPITPAEAALMEELKESPIISNLDDDVPYAQTLCVNALVNGLTAFLWLDDENPYNQQEFRNRYAFALNEAEQFIPDMVHTVYGIEE